MKKLIAFVLFALILAFSTTAIADSLTEYLQSMSSQEFDYLYKLVNEEYARRQSNTTSQETSTGNMLIGKTKLKSVEYCIPAAYRYSDQNGDYIIVQFDWTNTSNDSIMFVSTMVPQAFQDGVEISQGFVYNIETNSITTVLPGYGTTSYNIYKLKNNHDVLLSVDEFMDIGNKYPNKTCTIKLNSLEQWK